MRARVAEAIAAVEAAGEADRRDREALEGRIRSTLEALEGRIRTALEESEQRTAEASRALRETLLTSWEQTVESERSQRNRSHMEALERELSERAELARSAIERIRQSLDSQVAVTVQAAHAVAEAALGGVVDRLEPEAADEASGPIGHPSAPAGSTRGAGSVTEWLDELIRKQHAPPPYEPPAVRETGPPPVWEIEAPR